MKRFWPCLLTVLVLCVGKAVLHMFRLLLLAAIGLAAMYMLHMLAQDYNKIRQPAKPKLLGLFKRSTPHNNSTEEVYGGGSAGAGPEFPRDLTQILERDPLGCARKFVCHISAKPPSNLTTHQENILAVIRDLRWTDKTDEWEKAEEAGRWKRRKWECERLFPDCFYTGRMLELFMSRF